MLHHISEDANFYGYSHKYLKPHIFCNPITKTSRLMQFREIMDVYYKNPMERLYDCEYENYELVIC